MLRGAVFRGHSELQICLCGIVTPRGICL